jgi:lipoyl(octanoyl) transferase
MDGRMIEFQDWGLIDYNLAWDRQRELVAQVQKDRAKSYLIFCEHPSTITIGKSGSAENIIKSSEFLKSLGVDVVEIDRGGDVTLHNPRQLVGYPIFNLSAFKEDLHWFLREMEQSIIDAIARFGIVGGRVPGLTGVWIEESRKIAAMGFHCSRWVTSHGFALNVNNDMSEFDYIVPCGIQDKAVCSISQELKKEVDMELVKITVRESIFSRFEA